MFKTQIFIIAASIILFLITLELIRKKKLKEEYSIIWIIAELALLIFGLFPKILNVISGVFGVYYLTCIFLMAFLFLLVVLFNFSIILTKLSESNKKLIQEVALLKERNRDEKNK